MQKYVSVRVEPNKSYLAVNHDFINSHGRKVFSGVRNYLLGFGAERECFDRDTDLANSYNTHWISSAIKRAWDKAVWDYSEHHPRALKRNTKLFYSGVITFGNEDGSLSRDEIMYDINRDELDIRAFHFLLNFCEDNGIDHRSSYIVRHNDEAQVHYHFGFVGYDFKNHEVIRNRLTSTFLSQLQDKIGDQFKKLGFSRGIKKKTALSRSCSIRA